MLELSLVCYFHQHMNIELFRNISHLSGQLKNLLRSATTQQHELDILEIVLEYTEDFVYDIASNI
jgi:hypothetical protein